MWLLRTYQGKKNGLFYNLALRKPIAPLLKDDYNNIHTLETKVWYSQFGAMFFLLLFAVDITLWNIIAIILITMGSSAIGGLWFQRWINIGSGLHLNWEAKYFEWGIPKWFFLSFPNWLGRLGFSVRQNGMGRYFLLKGRFSWWNRKVFLFTGIVCCVVGTTILFL